MKYILLNSKKFIQSERILFALFAMCIITSFIVIVFIFGVLQNTRQEELEGQYGVKELEFYVEDENIGNVYLEDMLTCLESLDESILNKCYFVMAVQFEEDNSEIWEIKEVMSKLWTAFCIRENRITYSQEFNLWCEAEGTFASGTGFTKEQVENGELVCIAEIYDDTGSHNDEEVEDFEHKYDVGNDGKVVIDGKTYTVVCNWVDWFPWGSEIPTVPVTTLSPDCFIRNVFFNFTYHLSKEEFIQIQKAMRQCFGTNVKMSEVEATDIDMTKTYYVTILQCVFMMALAGIVVSVLFEYIVLKRKKQMSIYRICGLSLKKVYCSLILECLLYVTVFGTLGGLLFHFGLLPYFKTVYKYMTTYYTLQNYLILGGAYLVVITIVIYLMMKKTIRSQIVGMMKEV